MSGMITPIASMASQSLAARSPFGAAIANLISPNGSSAAAGPSGMIPGGTGAWQPTNTVPVTPVQPTPVQKAGSEGDIADFIRNTAKQVGIDPETALKVAKSEGGLKNWVAQSGVYKDGRQEPSFGPFQLLVGGGNTGFPEGLGNRFMAETGLDPRDPANAKAGIAFALKEASKNGWGQWYGAKKVGVGNWDGIGGRPPGGGGGTQLGTSSQEQKAAQPQSALDRVLATVGNPTVQAGATSGGTTAPPSAVDRVMASVKGSSQSQPQAAAPSQDQPAQDLGAQDVATTSQALLQKSMQAGATNNKQARKDQLLKRLRYQA